MEKAYPVRTEIINARPSQWVVINAISVRGIAHMEPAETFEVIGLFECLATKASDEELEFFRLLIDASRNPNPTE